MFIQNPFVVKSINNPSIKQVKWASSKYPSLPTHEASKMIKLTVPFLTHHLASKMGLLTVTPIQ